MLKFEDQFVGETVLSVLVSRLGFSRRQISKLKQRENGITVNGKHVTVRYVLKKGDTLNINDEDGAEQQSEKLLPSRVLPDIIFEDENIVIANKPFDMPTHQSHGHFNDTLANSLAYYYSLQDRPFVFRAINRLDRNTSGAVLIAKNALAASKLSRKIQSNQIKKVYIAILSGKLENDSGEIRTHTRRREKSVIFREVCSPSDDSKLAITQYEVIARGDSLTLVKATPLTGRTHQLRLHFAHLSAPILGDELYGVPSPLITRHALHSHSLEFRHPSSDEAVRFIAPVSEDMKRIIKENFKKEDIPNELCID